MCVKTEVCLTLENGNGFEIECMNIIKEVNFKPIGVLWPPLPI